MPKVSLPLQLIPSSTKGNDFEIHVFTDASLAAMSAVIYCRSPVVPMTTRYLVGKSRVAPIKQMSVPKLELEAAAIGVRLLRLVREQLSLAPTETFLWNDSSVLLDWIRTRKRQKMFVANRLTEILDHTQPSQ